MRVKTDTVTDETFRNACEDENIALARLLETIRPERYEIIRVLRYPDVDIIEYKIYPNNDRPTDYVLK